MFNKKEKNNLKDLEEKSILAKELIIEGDIVCKNPLLIFGKVFGVIDSSSIVLVERGGEVRGDIKANEVIIKGTIKGKIEANSLKVYGSGLFKGETKTSNLVIEEGAKFEANSQMLSQKDKNERLIMQEEIVDSEIFEQEQIAK